MQTKIHSYFWLKQTIKVNWSGKYSPRFWSAHPLTILRCRSFPFLYAGQNTIALTFNRCITRINICEQWSFEASGFHHCWHFFCFSLPWNQQTLLGYFAETGFFALGGFASVLYFSCYIMFYISFCFHHQAFYKIFQYHVSKLTDSQQNSSNNKKIIHKLIHFHSSIKEWVQLKHSGKYYSKIIVAFVDYFRKLRKSTVQC